MCCASVLVEPNLEETVLKKKRAKVAPRRRKIIMLDVYPRVIWVMIIRVRLKG